MNRAYTADCVPLRFSERGISRLKVPRSYSRDRLGRFDFTEDSGQACMINLRLHRLEYARIRAAAWLLGLSLSDLARQAVRADTHRAAKERCRDLAADRIPPRDRARVCLRCRVADWVLIQSRAEHCGVSMPAYVRDAVWNYIFRHV